MALIGHQLPSPELESMEANSPQPPTPADSPMTMGSSPADLTGPPSAYSTGSVDSPVSPEQNYFTSMPPQSAGGLSQQTSFRPAGMVMPLYTASAHVTAPKQCAICGDRASGKHYSVYSCEGCKGFFKRTVRKELTYTCRDDKKCLIDKRQRNRCQYCRYQKCLFNGMKREAVQEEKDKKKERGELNNSGGVNGEMPIESLLAAEEAVAPETNTYIDVPESEKCDPVTDICQAADKQLIQLVDWAKRIPHFVDLPISDQVVLLRAGWNELLIAGFSHRSIAIKDGLLLCTGLHIHRATAHQHQIGGIFDRVLSEVVEKMREIGVDKAELGCLRAIILFNPDVKGLAAVDRIEQLRDEVYSTLEDYCRITYPQEPGRFAKVLLRLPALRSIGLKCLETLFLFKRDDSKSIDSFLLEILEPTSTSGV